MVNFSDFSSKEIPFIIRRPFQQDYFSVLRSGDVLHHTIKFKKYLFLKFCCKYGKNVDETGNWLIQISSMTGNSGIDSFQLTSDGQLSEL
jgi:hypothetical protein